MRLISSGQTSADVKSLSGLPYIFLETSYIPGRRRNSMYIYKYILFRKIETMTAAALRMKNIISPALDGDLTRLKRHVVRVSIGKSARCFFLFYFYFRFNVLQSQITMKQQCFTFFFFFTYYIRLWYSSLRFWELELNCFYFSKHSNTSNVLFNVKHTLF